MNIRSLLTTSMGHRPLFSFAFALLFPFLTIFIERKYLSERKYYKWIRVVLLIAYSSGIVYLTLIDRNVSEHSANLTPFWTYQHWSSVEYRWIIFMNVLVFVPFGFMLPWALKQQLWSTALIGFTFSVTIEALQYFLGVGLCEFDDVFHNTLGTILGYGYWKVLTKRIQNKR